MSKVRYIISEAAKKAQVEAHVLRYWEEELELTIARNEMGHRYYTEEDIQLFNSIKDLKEQGFQLRAIKILIPEIRKAGGKNLDNLYALKEELNNQVGGEPMKPSLKEEAVISTPAVHNRSDAMPQVNGDKMKQFQMIIGNIVHQVLQENNQALGESVSSQVTGSVIKEMDYLMRMQDENEEGRYKRLDETIRSYQKTRQEAAAALEEPEDSEKKKKKRKLFGRNKTN